MNPEQDAATEEIMNILLALPWDQREDVFLAIKHNGIFCTYCGVGEVDRPNANCQCWNDE